MSERNLQSQELLPFFSNPRDGLGYRQHPASIVDGRRLMIRSDFVEWFTKGVNAKPWAKVVKSAALTEDQLMDELIEHVDARILESRNAAMFFSKNNFIGFRGQRLCTWRQDPSDYEIEGEKTQNPNLYAVVEELPYKRALGDTLYSKRPDLTFFLNGIYLGYHELKHNSTGQSARQGGRKKIIHDYFEAVRYLVDRTPSNQSDSEAVLLERRTLQLFRQAVTITASDLSQFFVMRSLHDRFYGEISRLAKSRQFDDETLKSEVEKEFSEFETKRMFGSVPAQTWQWPFIEHYSKIAWQHEFLYYNFIERAVDNVSGELMARNEDGKLISPRPKQKYAVDKCLNRIKTLIMNEHDPDFLKNEFLNHPLLQGESEEVRQARLRIKDKVNNNKNAYSLLLQYAAGFGKTNIIGWLSLRLKDLCYRDSDFVFDKILLVSDRLDLRESLNRKIFNMNVDNSLYTHADSRESLIQAMENPNARILVVNIQKFARIEDIFTPEMERKLRDQRIAFLIDEIHRSNTGLQHQNMMDSFGALSARVPGAPHKRNLIVGLTATPSDDVLLRFGEFKSPPDIFEAFDSFTMSEAQNAGFVLDPLQDIRGVSIPLTFDVDGEIKEEDSVDVKKLAIYESPERIKRIAHSAASLMFSTTFPSIHGWGKAMFACSSVKAAIRYFDAFQEQFEELKKRPSYERFRDAKVYVVYTENQQGEYRARQLMGMSESKAIDEFKAAKNAVMIVVRKLQTGFDEPRLHTLFLDREVHDIEAVQTVCRVNRTAKNKKSCLVMDFSHNNVNIENIRKGFEKYSDIRINDLNVEMVEKEFREVATALINHRITKAFITRFRGLPKNDASQALAFEKDVQGFLEAAPKEECSGYKWTVRKYLELIDTFKLVLNLPKDLMSGSLIGFARRMSNLIQTQEEKGEPGMQVNISVSSESTSIISEVIRDIEEASDGERKNRVKRKETPSRALNKLLSLNLSEELKLLQIEEFVRTSHVLFEKIRKVNTRQFAQIILSGKSNDHQDDVWKGFSASFKTVERKNRANKDIDPEFFRIIDPVLREMAFDFEEWITGLEGNSP